MSNTVNSSFKLRKDTLSNWTTNNPILLNGEIAVVTGENDTVFKVGDGVNHFNDLDYVSENEINTNILNSKKISNGLNNTTSGTYSETSGINNTASGSTTEARGYQSQATHANSWVWNGDTSLTYSTDYYVSKGTGTFCTNPVGGLNGFYIGNSNLGNILDNKVTKNNDITGSTKCKITYDSKGLVTSGTDLSVSDIPNLTLSKITDAGTLASKNSLEVSDIPSLQASKITSGTLDVNRIPQLSIGKINYLDETLNVLQGRIQEIENGDSNPIYNTYIPYLYFEIKQQDTSIVATEVGLSPLTNYNLNGYYSFYNEFNGEMGGTSINATFLIRESNNTSGNDLEFIINCPQLMMNNENVLQNESVTYNAVYVDGYEWTYTFQSGLTGSFRILPRYNRLSNIYDPSYASYGLTYSKAIVDKLLREKASFGETDYETIPLTVDDTTNQIPYCHSYEIIYTLTGLGIGALYPVSTGFSNAGQIYDFYCEYGSWNPIFQGTMRLYESSKYGNLVFQIESSSGSPVPYSGDALEGQNLTFSQLQSNGYYDWTITIGGQTVPIRIDLKPYYDANSYPREYTDKLLREKADDNVVVKSVNSITPVNGDVSLSSMYYTKQETDAIYMSRYNAEACINDYNRYRIIEDLKEISLATPSTASIYDIATKINEFLTMAKIKWTEDLKDVEYLDASTCNTYDCAAKLNEIMLILRS